MANEVEEPTQRLISVLRLLDEMTEANIARSREIKERIDHLLERLEAGERLPDIIDDESQVVIPQLLTMNIEALHEVGSMLRRAQAAALRADGYTMEQIGELFGVTRQRVSALLRTDPAE